MTFLERINGGAPLQAGDWAVIGTHLCLWLSIGFALMAVRRRDNG